MDVANADRNRPGDNGADVVGIAPHLETRQSGAGARRFPCPPCRQIHNLPPWAPTA